MYPETTPEYAEILGEGWPEPIEASEDLVRVTMFTAMQSKFFEFRVTRPDRWEIRGNRYDHGWFIDRGHLDQNVGFRAVPIGDRRDGQQMRWYHHLSGKSVHVFELEEATRLIVDFMLGDVELSRLGWMIRRR